jgi:hypothetical protein
MVSTLREARPDGSECEAPTGSSVLWVYAGTVPERIAASLGSPWRARRCGAGVTVHTFTRGAVRRNSDATLCTRKLFDFVMCHEVYSDRRESKRDSVSPLCTSRTTPVCLSSPLMSLDAPRRHSADQAYGLGETAGLNFGLPGGPANGKHREDGR